MTNTRNTPIEALGRASPLRVLRAGDVLRMPTPGGGGGWGGPGD